MASVAEILRENELLVSSLCISDVVDLSGRMVQKSIFSDCNYIFFQSLDHQRVDPQLQVWYLLRLVSDRISEDERVWEKFMILLANLGERRMYDCLIELTSDAEIWYDCLDEFTSDSDTKECLTMPKDLCSDNSYLSSADMPWLLEILVQVSYMWGFIAIVLGLSKGERENSRKGNNDESLNSVLSCWLAKDTSVCSVTMNTLLSALRSSYVNAGRVAQELEKRYRYSRNQKPKSESSRSGFSQSYDVEVADGKSTLLQVETSFRESVCYQWKKDGQLLTNDCTYHDVNEDILVVSHASQGMEGEYTCCVGSRRGDEIFTNKIKLTIVYPPLKKRLLDFYSVTREVPQDSWPPVGTKSFINLTVVESDINCSDRDCITVTGDAEKLVARKVKVEYSEVYGQYKSRALIVTEGRPGSGKTTLVHKIIKDWSKGIALRKAKYVFLVTLRILNSRTTRETLSSILQSIYRNEEELRDVCKEIETANGEGCVS